MTFENIPWAVGGGVVSPAMARMLAYQAAGGAEGVSGVGDLLVRQLSVAGGSVRIGSGGAILTNRYPGSKNESYMLRAGDETNVAVPANAGGSTRYDLVIARIDDWNMPGGQATPGTLPTSTVPAAMPQVLTNVGAGVTTAAELNLNYPAIALARLAVPAATSSITQDMITDLRQVAVPRSKRDVRSVSQVAGRDNDLTVTATTGEQFPDDGVFSFKVPEWATQAIIKSDLAGLYVPAGTVAGALSVRFGHGRADEINTQASLINFTAASAMTVAGMVADTVDIPATMRGQTVTVLLIGRKVGGTVNLKANAWTAFALDVEFQEIASEDV